MKTLIALSLVSFAVEVTAFGQGSPAQAPASPFPSASVAATASASVSPAEDLASRIHQRIEKKLRGHHGITIDADSSSRSGSDDIPAEVIPLVGIVFLTIFGAPVLIVIAIMYFGFSKNRIMHRTIRMMVEKGQPVPAALLAPPTPAVRQRSDMRRGVVLSMIGIGVMVWLGAVNDWQGGAWSLGLIPFLIGVGYLLVWKLEGSQKEKTDNPPPLP
jgi:hypothetical protein